MIRLTRVYSILIFSVLLLTGQVSQSALRCDSLFETIKEKSPKTIAATKSISDPSVSFMAKLLAIRSARETIDLSVYIFKNDEAGYLVLKELMAAKERGVKIRILVDAFGSFNFSGHFLSELTKNLQDKDQVQVLKINPLPNFKEQLDILNQFFNDLTKLRFRFSLPIARRMHDKIILIDANNKKNAKAIIGSSNIANEYAGLGDETSNFQDIDLVIRPTTNEQHNGSDIFIVLKDYINRFSQNAHKVDINKNDLLISNLISKEKSSLAIESLEERLSLLLDLKFFENQMQDLQNSDFFEAGFSQGELNFVTESRNVTSRQRLLRQKIENPYRSIYLSFRRAIKSANKKIEIVSPYFIISSKDILLLENWLQQDSERTLEIYTTSLHSSDSLVVQAYFDAVVAPRLLKLRGRLNNPDRLKIYSYKGQSKVQILHTKMIAVDESRTLITSSNFDGRSKYMNSEVGLWVEDPVLYKRIQESQLQELKAHSDLYASVSWKQRRQEFKDKFRLLFQEYTSHVLYFLGLENFL